MTHSNTNAPTCPACGVAYGDHLGLHGTCAALLEAQRERDELRDSLPARVRHALGVADGEQCPKCQGVGRYTYATTATWRGGCGGQAFTVGTCDHCWGSGTTEPWPSLQEQADEVQRKRHIDPDANQARCDLLDGYEEVLLEVGVPVGGNPDEAAGQTHHDLGVARMRLALAPLLALRAYLDGGADRNAEWGAVAEEDRHRIERFGDDVAQAFEGADDDPNGLHDEVTRLRAALVDSQRLYGAAHARAEDLALAVDGLDRLAALHRNLNRRTAEALGIGAVRVDPETDRRYLPSWHDMPERVAALRAGLAEVLGWMPTNREAWVDPARVAELRRLVDGER